MLDSQRLVDQAPARSKRPSARGFTLVELMITLAVLAIVLAVAVPSFQGMVNRNRLVAAANEMVATLQLARAEAVRRNRRVELCPSTDGATCSGSNWARLIVRESAAGTLIRDVALPSGGMTLGSSTNVATNNRIAFTAAGFARVGSGTATTGAISVCSDHLDAGENTLDVSLVASRVVVTPRAGGDACTGPSD